MYDTSNREGRGRGAFTVVCGAVAVCRWGGQGRRGRAGCAQNDEMLKIRYDTRRKTEAREAPSQVVMASPPGDDGLGMGRSREAES